MGEDRPITILLIEDDAQDAMLIREFLADEMKKPYALEHADRLSSALEILDRGDFDVVLLDLNLPDALGFEGFEKMLAHVPSLPVIVLTGSDDDELAIAAVQKGAQDYLVKGRVDGDLLRRSIFYSIERGRIEEERKKLITQLQEALANIKTLSGMLPICASCKKIRDDRGYWEEVATYITKHSDALFSHGMCPDCEKKAYEKFVKWKKGAQ